MVEPSNKPTTMTSNADMPSKPSAKSSAKPPTIAPLLGLLSVALLRVEPLLGLVRAGGEVAVGQGEHLVWKGLMLWIQVGNKAYLLVPYVIIVLVGRLVGLELASQSGG